MFVLIGMQLPAAVAGLTSAAVATGMLLTVAVYVTTLLARIGFLTISIFTIRAIDRRPQQRLLRTTARGRVLTMTAGLRGAISLAVALAVPATLPGGAGFPARDMIVFVTAGVVVTSLVVQGLALPRVIRWARLPQDTSTGEELRLARRTAGQEALEALPQLATDLGIGPEVVDEILAEYQQHIVDSGAHDDDGVDPAALRRRQYLDLRLALITRKRQTVVRLRDDRVIDDTVLRQIQARLGIEEIRLSGPQEVE